MRQNPILLLRDSVISAQVLSSPPPGRRRCRNGGSVYYVIPDGMHIGGTSRSFRPEARDLIERRIGEIARGVAGLDGASAESKYRATSSDHNSTGETEFAADVAAEICGSDIVIRNVASSMGGEDFSFMLNARPGAMLARQRPRR